MKEQRLEIAVRLVIAILGASNGASPTEDSYDNYSRAAIRLADALMKANESKV